MKPPMFLAIGRHLALTSPLSSPELGSGRQMERFGFSALLHGSKLTLAQSAPLHPKESVRELA